MHGETGGLIDGMQIIVTFFFFSAMVGPAAKRGGRRDRGRLAEADGEEDVAAAQGRAGQHNTQVVFVH